MKITISSTAIAKDAQAAMVCRSGAQDGQLAGEQAERRSAGDGDGAGEPDRADDREAAADQADSADVLGLVAAHHAAGAEEHQRLVQRMVEHVIERAGQAERTAEADAERDHAHVLDAGIGHQALDAFLAHDEQRGDEQREHAQRDQRQARHAADIGRIGDGQIADDADHGGVQQCAGQQRGDRAWGLRCARPAARCALAPARPWCRSRSAPAGTPAAAATRFMCGAACRQRRPGHVVGRSRARSCRPSRTTRCPAGRG